jgi:hypothetical protein
MNTMPFKATSKELQNSTIAYVIYWDYTLIKVVTEYMNPIRGEGYVNIFITVDSQHYIRCFEKKVSDLHLLNFINKFVNDVDYRQKYSK